MITPQPDRRVAMSARAHEPTSPKLDEEATDPTLAGIKGCTPYARTCSSWTAYAEAAPTTTKLAARATQYVPEAAYCGKRANIHRDSQAGHRLGANTGNVSEPDKPRRTRAGQQQLGGRRRPTLPETPARNPQERQLQSSSGAAKHRTTHHPARRTPAP